MRTTQGWGPPRPFAPPPPRSSASCLLRSAYTRGAQHAGCCMSTSPPARTAASNAQRGCCVGTSPIPSALALNPWKYMPHGLNSSTGSVRAVLCLPAGPPPRAGRRKKRAGGAPSASASASASSGRQLAAYVAPQPLTKGDYAWYVERDGSTAAAGPSSYRICPTAASY